MAPISGHKMVTFNIIDTSGEHKEFERIITLEISKYNFDNGVHVKMRAALKETNWDQDLGDVQNTEKVNENFTRTLTDDAKKAKIALYRQRRTIELEDRIIKCNSKWMAHEAQMQKQFIWTKDKQLKEEKIELNWEIKTLYQEKRQSEEKKVIKEDKNNLKAFHKYANKCRKYTSKIVLFKVGSK